MVNIKLFSSHYYKISFYSQFCYISFDGEKLIVYDKNYKKVQQFYYSAPQNSLYKSLTSDTDTYQGTFLLFSDYFKDLELIVFSSEVEVDGFFEILEEIKLNSFKAQIAFSNV